MIPIFYGIKKTENDVPVSNIPLVIIDAWLKTAAQFTVLGPEGSVLIFLDLSQSCSGVARARDPTGAQLQEEPVFTADSLLRVLYLRLQQQQLNLYRENVFYYVSHVVKEFLTAFAS